MACAKHKTKFQSNQVRKIITQLPGSTLTKTSVVGFYKCIDCDFVRFGAPNMKADWPRI